MADHPKSDDWLGKKLLDETSLSYRTVWSLYLQFYTVFLTFSIVALGLTLEHVSRNNRWPIAFALIIQNLLSAATAGCIARFSGISARRYEELCKIYIEADPEHKKLAGVGLSPLPGWLGTFGGYANLVSHVLLIACWVAILFM